MRRVVVVVLVSSVIAACGHDKPTAPSTSAPPAVTALTMAPATDLLTINGTEHFVLTAAQSDGTSQVVLGTWGSDAPLVATVDPGGKALGLGAGVATVYADYGGQRATRLLRVVPDYSGQWVGAYSVSACAESGDWDGVVCHDEDPSALWLLPATFTQQRADVTGTVSAFSDFPVQVSGSIAQGGLLTLSGTSTATFDAGTGHLQMDWQMQSTDNQNATGQFTMVLSFDGVDGAVTYTCTIVGLENGTAVQRVRASRLRAHPMVTGRPRRR